MVAKVRFELTQDRPYESPALTPELYRHYVDSPFGGIGGRTGTWHLDDHSVTSACRPVVVCQYAVSGGCYRGYAGVLPFLASATCQASARLDRA